ncbi:MAG: UDP-N-acetylmuramoyl-tripeptide--D-alanyl-D-alanine ligase [Clostridiales bacterium]|nr:UDP-N-acetylmuramoyl-tripeptide--D-alanyl-D-alanine ligase [Clostridiales bacterium]
MEKLKLSEIASACGGTFNKECEINSVCIDTRKITKGCLFICIKGERFDAHDFVGTAEENGAVAVMVHKPVETDLPVVTVPDTSKALLALGGYYRSKFDIPLIGLTGSIGKTTTKEFTYLVASSKFNTIKTLGNLNNEIGLSQTLFQIDSKTQSAVVEMGMNHFGEISRLSQATKPTMAVITNIGVSHIENLGSRQGILKAKLEILNGLEKGSPLILNGDNDLLSQVKNDDYDIRSFGIDNRCDFTASDICEENAVTSFTVNYFSKNTRVSIPTVGVHNVYNALSAFAIGYYLGIDAESISNALMKYEPEGMRQRTVEVGGIVLIEDCYNASPDSMTAAVKTLSSTKADRCIAVLSDMLELGDYSRQAHINVGSQVGNSNINALFTCGEMGTLIAQSARESKMKNVFHFDSKDELANSLCDYAKEGDAILFKASRGMKLEDVIRIVKDRWENK